MNGNLAAGAAVSAADSDFRRPFRDALGHFASGITVLTGEHDGKRLGMTCQSFFSVSLEPPLISVSVSQSSSTFPNIRSSGQFCVNVLTARQRWVSDRFAASAEDRWRGLEPAASPAGNPIIPGSLMWIDCTIVAEHLSGDHALVVGEVTAFDRPQEQSEGPLLYYRGAYRVLRGAEAVI
ncbi:oxidoreductase [Acrocarpospora pleiomorpha]|uniref:Oxidoreductase n=1 Tax=Acrocarpospora pleiomorpha TaxID=90975 RepID=A0A5M3XGX9_9ACTN|nr:flavin reductase family protein [Acrocarpospora pleiomorpha]GES17338.1 oxidoreductase [Acrocarpospora pleiomorpha]